MNRKEPNNQDSSESKDSDKSGMKMMMWILIACCAIPLAIIIFAGVSWRLMNSHKQLSNPQPTSQPSNSQKSQN